MTTLYFKDHSASMKDQSTMKNALGYKFEKKNKESHENTKENYEKNANHPYSPGYKKNKNFYDETGERGYNSQRRTDKGWVPYRKSFGYASKGQEEFKDSQRIYSSRSGKV